MTDPGLLYHRTRGLYQKGDRIAVGNWGRTVLGSGPNHNFYYREYLFEKIRLAQFSDKPSRLQAVFAFVDAAFAMTWRPNLPEYVYAVRLADPMSTTHRGDMSWIDVLHSYRSFDAVEECARRYWRGDERGPDAIEILATCELVVEGRLTKIPDNGFEVEP